MPACPSASLRRRPCSGMRLLGLTFLMALSACACKKTPEAPRDVPMPSVSSKAAPSSWEAKLGHVITVEGKTEDAKLGALLDQAPK